jgi:DnaJ like chaperone protein
MGLLGALVGGGIGFLFGGPLGAMIGGALGSQVGEPVWSTGGSHRSGDFHRIFGRCSSCGKVVAFDPHEPELICPRCGARLNIGRPRSSGASGFGRGGRRASAHERAWSADPRYAQEQAQSAFMVALISLAAKVAKADGHVTRAEIRSFDQFLKNDLGMGTEDRRIAARIFNEARDSTVGTAEFTRQIRSLLGHQPDRLRDLVCLLLKVALADGRLSREEDRLIRSIAGELGLGPRDFEECLALFRRGNLDAAYALLGVDAAAQDAEVRRAYRRLAKEYHPDVIASKGLSTEFQDFAMEKMRAVNEAYDRIKEARGIR